jgi:hypothetical protein
MTADLNERTFDPPGEVPPAGGDAIRQAASESVRAGVDIRARIHDVTLLALRSRRFDRHGMRDVVQAVTSGVALGAQDSRADLRKALAEAFRGMDEAITRSADASRVALRRLVVAGRDLSDSDVKLGLAQMKRVAESPAAWLSSPAAPDSRRRSPRRTTRRSRPTAPIAMVGSWLLAMPPTSPRAIGKPKRWL